MATLGRGNAIITLSIVFGIVASYAVFFSAFLPATNLPVCTSYPSLDALLSSSQLCRLCGHWLRIPITNTSLS